MSNINTAVKQDGKIKIAGCSKVGLKEINESPNSDKKLAAPPANKSNIPKSGIAVKSQQLSHRPQSSYSSFNKDKVSGESEETHQGNRTRGSKSKTPLGHSSVSFSSQTNDSLKHRASNHSVSTAPPPQLKSKSVSATGVSQRPESPGSSLTAESLNSSSAENSPRASPKLDPANETSDDSLVVSDNPEDAGKPPFVITQALPENSTTHLHVHEGDKEAGSRGNTPACCHTALLASKKRSLNKRPGHLRHMKTLSVARVQTLKDYLSIYEERLGRIKADQPILLEEAQQRCDEIVCRITAQWMGIKTQIQQQYEVLIKETENHRSSIVEELQKLEALQNESSTLYDICDLEEDDHNLERWVRAIKEKYNFTLTEYSNTQAMDFFSSISIEGIDSLRTGHETQMQQLYISIPNVSVAPPPPPPSSDTESSTRTQSFPRSSTL